MNFKFFSQSITVYQPFLLEAEWVNGALHIHLGVNFRFIHIEPAKPTP